jgi:hypothetical protein
MDKAYNIAVSIISGIERNEKKDEELVGIIEEEFAEDLTNVVKGLAASQVREELVFAACLLKYRIDPQFEIDTISAIHPDLITGLAALYRDEDKRSVEAFKSEDESTATAMSIEEAEKKPERATKSRSKTTTGG